MSYKDEILELLDASEYKPMNDQDLLSYFELQGKDIGQFFTIMEDLEKSGLIVRTKKDRYVLPKTLDIVVGTLRMNRKGFGFVLPDSDDLGDVYISPDDLCGAMNNDKVAVKLSEPKGDNKSREGAITNIVSRNNHEIVGTFEKGNGFGFVIPDDRRITQDVFISKKDYNGANSGDKVVAKVTKWAKDGKKPEGIITEILGSSEDSGTDILGLIRQHRKTETFPNKVEKELKKIETTIPKDEIGRRKDFRGKNIFTIDGADAKDLDDGVSIKKLKNGNYSLGVHIADVTYYVRENTNVDSEALKRGTSIYLIDRVVPMLPKILSNGMCSLNPKVDRLTLSIEMEIDQNGKVLGHNICESVINSVERLTYTDVSDILENDDKDLIDKYAHIETDLRQMADLAKILRKRRETRGSLDFDFDEAKIQLNEDGVPVEIYAYERRTANKLIEEFMLKANETIAEHFYWLDMPFVYRIHEEPSLDKMTEFKKFIHNFGYTLKGSGDVVHPKSLQDITNKIKGKKEENVINRIMLRSLKKAEYYHENRGHFGLAAEYYCHFTSPIRRYPDLMIHRIIKESLTGNFSKKRIAFLEKMTEEVGIKSSEAEKVAEEMEREVEDLKKAEYMSYRIGQEYLGIVSGVTSFGIFIELENTVEGLVRITDLTDDYYIHDKDHFQLIGEQTKKVYALGQELLIRVKSVSIPNREVNFELV